MEPRDISRHRACWRAARCFVSLHSGISAPWPDFLSGNPIIAVVNVTVAVAMAVTKAGRSDKRMERSSAGPHQNPLRYLRSRFQPQCLS